MVWVVAGIRANLPRADNSDCWSECLGTKSTPRRDANGWGRIGDHGVRGFPRAKGDKDAGRRVTTAGLQDERSNECSVKRGGYKRPVADQEDGDGRT